MPELDRIDAPKVLFVGPLPPPIGGYAALFEALIAAWAQRAGVAYSVVNTSPGRIKSHPGIGSVVDVVRGFRIAVKMVLAARSHDAIVFVTTTGLFQRLMPVIRFVRRRYQIPFFLWFSGGVVHDVVRTLPPGRRRRLLADLRAVEGVIVETRQVLDGLRALGVLRVTAVPNPRVVDWSMVPPPRSSPADPAGLRLVFFSRIVEDKGIFVLLDAVGRAAASGVPVALDIFGSIDPDLAATFDAACRDTPGAQYRGVYRGDAPALLAGYDAVVLPTWFPREGHPGVLVEAMMAGVPVVTTHHMAIPELVSDGVNGLLVTPRDADALARAIQRLAAYPDERFVMGAAHRSRLARHDAAEAAGKLLEMIEPERSREVVNRV
ncbi:MAG: glycosyltransferase family 4 protein [Rhodothermales bacterium]|nr:glycosyltransferase family 4 protein [Rhodothermales bacterium]